MLYMASYQVNKVLSKFLFYLVEPGPERGPTDTSITGVMNVGAVTWLVRATLVRGRHGNDLVVLCCI